VLAAALSADADILLTDNARHWMAARHVELLTSAQLLTPPSPAFGLGGSASSPPPGCQKYAVFVAPSRWVT
jgi:hypothetical protein